MSPRALVVIIGFLDTKLEEHIFVRDQLVSRGCDVEIIDISTRLQSPGSVASVTTETICKASGRTLSLQDFFNLESRSEAVEIMVEGAKNLLLSQEMQEKVCGVMCVGGSTSTAAVCAVMRELKIGLPKLCVSTMASGDVSTYIGDSDITIMPSIVDISGRLNDISRRILMNASAAMAGMACGYSQATDETPQVVKFDNKRIAISMFGLTTKAVTFAMEHLSSLRTKGSLASAYIPVVFHATGSGGRSMERLIMEGWFDGLLDITITELADELAGGVLSAGPTRLTAAGKKGLPQVISLGALDMVNFGAASTVPERYRNAGRRLYEHNSSVTLMRTNTEESRQLGLQIAEKLRASTNASLTVVVIPLRGFSDIDIEGGPFRDFQADEALVSALKTGLEGSGIRIVEVDANINERKVALTMVSILGELLALI